MSDIRWFEEEVMGMQLFTSRQRSAAAYLESLNQRFLIDFGVDNCESKAASKGWEP